MSRERRKHMVLTLFSTPSGYHHGAWRMPGSGAERWGTLEFMADIVRAAEQAKIDAVFWADVLSAEPIYDGGVSLPSPYEPITTLSALAGLTEHIGLIGTASTTFNHPYTIARQFNMLDQLSGGRAGWNIVTSYMGNENYGMTQMPDSAARYRQAREFVEVATKLWKSWDEDAVIIDRAAGRWVDPTKLHRIDHRGEFYTVRGPLNLRRSPQTGPVLVQAGSSGPGIDLGASYAEIVYSAQYDRQGAIDFYATYKDAVVAKGREVDDVALLPGILPIIGDTEAEAKQIAAELADCIDYDTDRKLVSRILGIDVSDLDLDDRIPEERFTGVDPATVMQSRTSSASARAVAQGWTLRQLITDQARGAGHHWIIGSAQQVADEMIDWFDARACDGFIINPPSMPAGFRAIADKLIPLLQERGYFHDDYAGGTLRENIMAGRAGGIHR
jgi:FMN-dependent oxidoreductase (nitrilotriacetate monooxygenase family)